MPVPELSSGKKGIVEAVVFNTTEVQDAAMDAYLVGRLAQNANPNRQHYSLFGGHNCGTLACEALNAAGRNAPVERTMQTPANIFSNFMASPGLFGVTQTYVYAPPKGKVTSKICFPDEQGNTVCQ